MSPQAQFGRAVADDPFNQMANTYDVALLERRADERCVRMHQRRQVEEAVSAGDSFRTPSPADGARAAAQLLGQRAQRCQRAREVVEVRVRGAARALLGIKKT